LFARGTILRGIIADAKSPLVYGYNRNEVPVYFSLGPVLNASNLRRSPAPRRRGGRGGSEHRAEHDADGESAQAVAVGSGQDGHGLRLGDEHRQ
jgi:hypothetical protein